MNQIKKCMYLKPTCEIIKTELEDFLCVSVTPDAANSSEGSWNPEQQHEGGIIIGDGTGIAPAKPSISWFDDED